MPGLEIHAGALARRALLERGLRPELFDVPVGASGGPKWLVISALDRQLFPWPRDVSTVLRGMLAHVLGADGARRCSSAAASTAAGPIRRCASPACPRAT